MKTTRILLDTNIIIHREANRIVNKEIGLLFNWFDKLNYQKYIHPETKVELKKHMDSTVVETMFAKTMSYNLLNTISPDDEKITNIRETIDKTENDRIDTSILKELYYKKFDYLITEDKKIFDKAIILGIADKVFTISGFVEKATVENPELVDYKVLSVKKEFFGNIDINDPFFDSFKEDYFGFTDWFRTKSENYAYICKTDDKISAFLYVKVEDTMENYSDINPQFTPKKRLKIGTFKVDLNGYKLGERFLKIIFDNALINRVEEIYLTIFNKRYEHEYLINLLKNWGFSCYGVKKTESGTEEVYIRDFLPHSNRAKPRITYPYIAKNKNNIYIVPIYPEYHTELFPDSILRTESPLNFIENEPYRNAIRKIYISRSYFRNLESGDIILFYRTGGYHKGVLTTIGLVENIIKTDNIRNSEHFVSLCRKRSVFSDDELVKFWNYNPNNRPFIVNFLYIYSLPKRLNLSKLIDLNIIRDINSVPRGFEEISLTQFNCILKEAEVNGSFIVD